jgi:hypothetical protein
MDYIRDQSGRHLLHLASLIEEPDYVKKSSLELDEIAQLSSHEFADPTRRELPIHTPGHTFISWGYCKSAGISNPDILQRIQKAGELHQIADDLKKIDEAFATQTKSASAAPAPRYAIYMDFEEPESTSSNPHKRAGGVHGFYPINDDLQIEESARKLANDRSRIPIELFVEGCREIVKIASTKNVPKSALPPVVLSYGEERLADVEHVKIASARRVRLTGDPIYNDIALSFLEADEPDRDAYASLMKQADDQNALKYSKALEDPWSVFHSGKSASAHQREMDAWAVINDSAVPVSAVRSVPDSTFQKFFAKADADTLISFTKEAATRSGPDITNAAETLDKDLARRYLAVLAR